MNYLFGSNFMVKDERCTKGVYGSLIRTEIPEIDFAIILDSEGLQSIEKNDPVYDRKIALFCLSISNIIIINAKDITVDLIKLFTLCVEALKHMEANSLT
jgi:hypothetical protein